MHHGQILYLNHSDCVILENHGSGWSTLSGISLLTYFDIVLGAHIVHALRESLHRILELHRHLLHFHDSLYKCLVG